MSRFAALTLLAAIAGGAPASAPANPARGQPRRERADEDEPLPMQDPRARETQADGKPRGGRAGGDEPLPMQDPGERGTGDALCLRWLAEHDVPFAAKPDLKEVRTPIEVRGMLGGVRLVPRAGRAPVMDC